MSEFDWVIAVKPDFDLLAVESILRASHLIHIHVPRSSDFDECSVAHHIAQRHLFDLQSTFLLDLNVLIPIVNAVNPRSETTQHDRAAAALMAVANLADVSIEPVASA